MQRTRLAPELSKQDAFARHVFQEGYPLWNPDTTLLPPDRQANGLEIGDIGIVDEDGCFNTVLNIYHSPRGEKPDIYECETFDLGHVFSSPRTCWRDQEQPAPYYTGPHVVNNGRVITQYTASLTKDGSHVIAPQGAKCFKLSSRDKHILRSLAADHGRRVAWFNLASERLGFTPKSLHVISALYQTHSWSLASFDKMDDREVAVCCELVEEDGKVQMGRSGSHWAPRGRFSQKIGPPPERQGNCNQTIFIQSFTITHVDNKQSLRPSRAATAVTQKPAGRGTSASAQRRPTNNRHGPSNRHTGGSRGASSAARTLAIESTAVIEHMPPKSLASPPVEAIHLDLLAEQPTANAVVTHSNLWTTMLANGELPKLEELTTTLAKQRSLIILNNGVIHLRRFQSLHLESSLIDISDCIKKGYGFPFARHYFGDLFESTLHCRGQDLKVAVRVVKIEEAVRGSGLTMYKTKKQVHRMLELWSELNHRDILPLIWEFEDGDQLHIVSPWTEHGTLTSYLELKHRELTQWQLLSLIYDVVSGLYYLHSKNILHSALSGSNIVIDAQGSAMLSGISHAVVPDEQASTLIAHSDGADPLRWTAPESLGLWSKLSSSRILTQESNVYSLGQIMLQIYSGKVPYHYYETKEEIAAAIHRNEMPQRPTDPRLTSGRWKIIENCCKKDNRPLLLVVFRFCRLEFLRTRPEKAVLKRTTSASEAPITKSEPVLSDKPSLIGLPSTRVTKPILPLSASMPASPLLKGAASTRLSGRSPSQAGSVSSLTPTGLSGTRLSGPLARTRSLSSERRGSDKGKDE